MDKKYCIITAIMYNHLRKWRVRWIHVTKLRALSGAQLCEDTNTIILESEHY